MLRSSTLAPAAVAKLPSRIALVRCYRRADRLEVELHSREKARISALHHRAGSPGLRLSLPASDSCAAWRSITKALHPGVCSNAQP